MAKGGYTSMSDMFDGGGAGRAGQRFEGGALSGMLNQMGVRPHGYMDRMAQQRPQMRPPMQAPRPMAPQAPAMRPGPMFEQGGRGQAPAMQPRFSHGPHGPLMPAGGEVDPAYISRLVERAQQGDMEAIRLLQVIGGM